MFLNSKLCKLLSETQTQKKKKKSTPKIIKQKKKKNFHKKKKKKKKKKFSHQAQTSKRFKPLLEC